MFLVQYRKSFEEHGTQLFFLRLRKQGRTFILSTVWVLERWVSTWTHWLSCRGSLVFVRALNKGYNAGRRERHKISLHCGGRGSACWEEHRAQCCLENVLFSMVVKVYELPEVLGYRYSSVVEYSLAHTRPCFWCPAQEQQNKNIKKLSLSFLKMYLPSVNLLSLLLFYRPQVP